MSTFFAKFPATPSMKPQDLIGLPVTIQGKPAGTITKAVQADPDTINVQVESEPKPLLTITVNREKWRKLADAVTPAHHHHEGMNECNICDRPVVDSAILRIRELESNLVEVRSQRDMLADCLNHLRERDWFREGVTGREVACGLDPDKVRAALAPIPHQTLTQGGAISSSSKELSSNGKDTARVMGGDSGFNSPAARLDAIPSRLAWFSTKDGEVEVVRKSDVTEIISAAINLISVKGRHHSQQAYERLEKAVALMQGS